jgi:hypothetical protein
MDNAMMYVLNNKSMCAYTHTHTHNNYKTSLFADTCNIVANISRVKWLLKKSDYHMN